jgi:hypothetical protein
VVTESTHWLITLVDSMRLCILLMKHDANSPVRAIMVIIGVVD